MSFPSLLDGIMGLKKRAARTYDKFIGYTRLRTQNEKSK